MNPNQQIPNANQPNPVVGQPAQVVVPPNNQSPTTSPVSSPNIQPAVNVPATQTTPTVKPAAGSSQIKRYAAVVLGLVLLIIGGQGLYAETVNHAWAFVGAFFNIVVTALGVTLFLKYLFLNKKT